MRAGVAAAALLLLVAVAGARGKPAPRKAACPSTGALPARLAQVWKLKGGKVLGAQCAEGSFGWAVAAWVKGPGTALVMRRSLLDAKGKLLADLQSDKVPVVMASQVSVTALQTADLDGDGISEIVETVRSSNGGFVTVTVYVYRFVDGKLKRILTQQLDYDNTAGVAPELAVTCTGSFAIDAGKITFTGKVEHQPKAEPGDWADCVSGSQSYVIKDGELVGEEHK